MSLFFVILLGVLGVVLLLLELFLLPGFGVAGIGGIFSLSASVVVAYIYIGHTAGTITLIASMVLGIVGVIYFFSSHTVDKMGLDATIDSKVGLASPGKRMEEEMKKSDEPKSEN